MTEFEGALGLAGLKDFRKNLRIRKQNALYLMKHLSRWSNILQLPSWPEYTENAHTYFPMVLIDESIKRGDLLAWLEEHNIETRTLWPMLSQPVFINMYGNLLSKNPVAAYLDTRGFFVGCHPGFTKQDLAHIVRTLEEFLSDTHETAS